TLDTGGDSFFLGFQTPVAFRPFLQQLTGLLGQQYLLTFRAALPQKAGFHDLKVSTEMSGVELMVPSRVYLPERPYNCGAKPVAQSPCYEARGCLPSAAGFGYFASGSQKWKKIQHRIRIANTRTLPSGPTEPPV